MSPLVGSAAEGGYGWETPDGHKRVGAGETDGQAEGGRAHLEGSCRAWQALPGAEGCGATVAGGLGAMLLERQTPAGAGDQLPR
jgi:hypothetical protein